jgi:TPR repeat protein
MSTVKAGKDKRLFTDTLKSARLGLADAQYEVGLMYANGIGVTKSIGQAVHWVRESAQRGFAAAQYLLATRFEAGEGVPQSEHQALIWYAKAAEQGHAKAMFRAGKLFEKSHQAQAAELYQQAANAGLAEAQAALGHAFEFGEGVDRDLSMAVRWYTEAAGQGLAAAQCALAELYAEGKGVERDTAKAIEWWQKAASQDHLGAQVALEFIEAASPSVSPNGVKNRRAASERRKNEARWIHAAENGNADSKYYLGLMYSRGLGMEPNVAEATRWFALAAGQGHAKAQLELASVLEAEGSEKAVECYMMAAEAGLAGAQCALGRLYRDGGFVPRDPLKSQHWFARAADQGWPEALRALSELLDSDTAALTFDYCRRAAESGDVPAMLAFARKLEQGKGCGKDPYAAFRWYEKAAEKGNTQAACSTGVAFFKGVGTKKNLPAAVKWLTRAAEEGDARAQWSLSALFASGGEGVSRDLKQAFLWCERAAEQGFVAAQSNLGLLYALSDRPALAAEYWQKAADKLDPEALYNLALAKLKGQGVPKDDNQAFGLLISAAEQGVTAAQSRLGLIYATGQGVAQDSVEAHKWFEIAAKQGDTAAQANIERCKALNSPSQFAEGLRRAALWRQSRGLGPT